MNKQKEIDLDELERLVGQGLSDVKVLAALNLTRPSLVRRLARDEAALAAYNRGRAAAGKSPWAHASQASDTRTKEPSPALLDETTKTVLREIRDSAPISLEDLMSQLRLDSATVTRATRTLISNGLINAKTDGEGHLQFSIEPGQQAPPKWRKGRPRKATISQDRSAPAAASESHETTAPAAPVNYHIDNQTGIVTFLTTPFNGHNGHTDGVLRALEAARVELLYLRVHREQSPHFADVVERIESQLETLVTAEETETPAPLASAARA